MAPASRTSSWVSRARDESRARAMNSLSSVCTRGRDSARLHLVNVHLVSLETVAQLPLADRARAVLADRVRTRAGNRIERERHINGSACAVDGEQHGALR